jgi:hypothetical protein
MSTMTMLTTTRRRRPTTNNLLTTAAALCFSGTALAVDWNFSTVAGPIYTDNITRNANKVGATAYSLALLGGLESHTRTLDAVLNATTTHREYSRSEFDGNTASGATLELGWSLVPETVKLIVEDNYGQVARNNEFDLVLGSTEDVNFLTAGPDFNFRLGEGDVITLSGRYDKTNYSESLIGGTRTYGLLDYEHDLGGSKSLGVGVAARHNTFDRDDLFEDFDVQTAYVDFELDNTRVATTVEVGAQRLQRVDEDFSGGYADISFRRNVNRYLTATFTYRQSYADAADIFRFQQRLDPNLTGAEDVQAVADPVKDKRAALNLQFSGNRLSLTTLVEFVRERYTETFINDRNSKGIRVGATYRVGPRVTALATLGAVRQDLVEIGAVEKDFTAGVGAEFALSRHFRLQGSVGIYDRSGNQNRYREKRAALFLTYSVFRVTPLGESR